MDHRPPPSSPLHPGLSSHQLEGSGQNEGEAESWQGSPSVVEGKGRTPRGKVSFIRKMRMVRSASPSSSSPTTSRVWKARKEEGGGEARGPEELGLPLGMSFAVVLSQIWEKKQFAGQKIPADLSMICVAAVKEAVANVYGEKYEYFLRNFEKSFSSTMRTCQVTSEGSITEQENLSCLSSNNKSESMSFHDGPQSSDYIEDIQENHSRTSDYIQEIQLVQYQASEYIEEIKDNESSNGEHSMILLNEPNNQQIQLVQHHASEYIEEIKDSESSNGEHSMILLNEPNNQQLISIPHGSNQALSQALLTTLEKSVLEQRHSNQLKRVELDLTLQRMQMKKSELNLSFYSNVLEQAKISMGLKQAQFKEEKLKNQMKDLRHTEFIRRCIDLLVSGLLIMSILLGYATWVYSYKRLAEATEACMHPHQEPKRWWMPKQVYSLNTALVLFQCHAIVLSRLLFGAFMILSVAYILFQRSAGPGPVMPVTFILFMLGGICGVAGMFCIGTLGGDGYSWLLYWEIFCLSHFLANAFPSFFYHFLYGQVLGDPEPKLIFPYWIRRLGFYIVLLLILPTFGGLLPFASLSEWKGHFTKLILSQINLGDGHQ